MTKRNSTHRKGEGKCGQCDKSKGHAHTGTGGGSKGYCEKHEEVCPIHPHLVYNKKDGCAVCAKQK